MKKKLLLALSLLVSILSITPKSQAAIFYFDFTSTGFTPSSININVSDTVIFRWTTGATGTNNVSWVSTAPCTAPIIPNAGNVNSVAQYDTIIVTCFGTWTFQDNNGINGTINIAPCTKVKAGLILRGGEGVTSLFYSCACHPKSLVDTIGTNGLTRQWWVDTSTVAGTYPAIMVAGATDTVYTPTVSGLYYTVVHNFCGDTMSNKVKILIRPCNTVSVTYNHSNGNYQFHPSMPAGSPAVQTQIWIWGDTHVDTFHVNVLNPFTHIYSPYPFPGGNDTLTAIFISYYGCSDTVTLILPNPSQGINNITEGPAFTVSPNPAANLIHVNSTLVNPSFTITDVTGRNVSNFHIVNQKGTEYTIDISDVPNGLYIIRANNDELTTSEKLIIQR